MTGRNAQCKVAGVKGISDAIRETINTWITDDLITLLFAQYEKSGGKLNPKSFAVRAKNADAWKRYKRGNDPQGTGFFRTYYCKDFGTKGVVDLRVLTNFDDTVIKYVMFYIDGKMVYAGACNVPSTRFPSYGYKPMLQNTVQANISTSTTVAFVPFTEAQLQKLATQYEFGGMGAIDRMFEERV